MRILKLKSKNLPFQQTPQVNWIYSNVWQSFLATCTRSSVRCNELVLSQAETSWNNFVSAVELTRSASDGYFILGFLALYLPFGRVLHSAVHWPDLGVVCRLLGSPPLGCNWMGVKSFRKWWLKDRMCSQTLLKTGSCQSSPSQRRHSHHRLVCHTLRRSSFALEGWASLPRVSSLWND